MEPGVLLHRDLRVNFTEPDHLLTSAVLQLLPLASHGALSLVQHPEILLDEAIGDLAEGCVDIFKEIRLAVGYVLAQKRKDLALVGAEHHLVEGHVSVLFLRLFLVADVAADEQEDRERHHDAGGDESADVHQHSHEEAENEGCSGCDEPASDDGDDTSHSIDSALSSPGTVGQRGTHRYHECDVSC